MTETEKPKGRFKACTLCRKSKIKCLRGDEKQLACKRCLSLGLQCVFEYKVPSYKLANDLVIDQPTYTPQPIHLLPKEPTPTNSNVLHINNILNPDNSSLIRQPSSINPTKQVDTNHIITKMTKPTVVQKNSQQKSLNNWETSVEDRLDGFGSQLSTILALLKDQHRASIPTPSSSKDIDFETDANTGTTSSPTRIRRIESISDNESIDEQSTQDFKRQKLLHLSDAKLTPDETLKSILSMEDANELFHYFNTNISPQLFGFDISKYSIVSIWETCPLLIATICCIASIHHSKYNYLSNELEKLIYKFSENILFKIPDTEIQAFNTIIALCFCGFWFKNNQMFTGLAVQLSNTYNLIDPNSCKKSIIPRKDKLKLWYLLYILDGQQSLVFNRKSIIDSKQPSLKNSKKILEIAQLNDEKDLIDTTSETTTTSEEDTNTDTTHSPTSHADIRLISQVEYHQAIDAVFEGQAWDLLTPSSFGLPFKTNLELDKWMVQWTVLLSPFKNNPVWSSKSTLIYYNFAKMHINSSAVRNFHSNGINLPRFDEIEDDFEEVEDGSPHQDEQPDYDSDTDDSDDDTQELMKEMSPIASKKISAELALSSAETVLNIVLGDSDILSVLKYVPIHIHIMLYYAAVLILKPDVSVNSEQSFETSINAIKLVKRLRHSVIVNSPTDREFSTKIVDSLSSLLVDKVQHMKQHMGLSGLSDNNIDNVSGIKSKQLKLIDEAMNDNDIREIVHHQSKKNQQFKISAWPGFDAGHPTKSAGKGNTFSPSPPPSASM